MKNFKILLLAAITIIMHTNVIAQDGMAVETDILSGRITGEGEVKNNNKVGIWKYYSNGADALADYGDGSGEPITKYFDRKERLVFIGDHYVQHFFSKAFRVGILDDEPYQFFIGFEDLKEENILLHGLWKEYNENGILISKTKLVEGNKDGFEDIYYDSGNLKEQRFYYKGDLDTEEIFYDSGKVKRECHFKYGEVDLETCRYYDENGNERSYDIELAYGLYYDKKEYNAAFQLFNEAAKDGEVIAKQFLAMMYQDGLGVEKDIDMALKLYDELCKKNIEETCNMLGNIHFQEASAFIGKEQYTKALFHAKEAANTGNIDAKYYLAYMHHLGLGTEIDLDYALQLYLEISDKDYPNVCTNIGMIYLAGEDSIIAEMNSLGTSSEDMKRYDELKVKSENMYRKALVYFEKAYKIEPSEELSATINSIKSILEN